jgi:four helix bundle protein
MTSTLPSNQKFGLARRMPRDGVSIPANIAEGFKRRSRADKAHFYKIARGSLGELRYYFILGRDLGYKLEYDSLAAQADQIRPRPNGLTVSMGR